MPIEGEFFIWNENATNIQENPGVYAFFGENHELIYIGQSENLRERFQGYWNRSFDENPCLRSTRFYKREVTDNHGQRERELLEEYENEHGSLPSCNIQHP